MIIYGNIRQYTAIYRPLLYSAKFCQDYNLKPILPRARINQVTKLIIYTLLFLFPYFFSLYNVLTLLYSLYIQLNNIYFAIYYCRLYLLRNREALSSDLLFTRYLTLYIFLYSFLNVYGLISYLLTLYTCYSNRFYRPNTYRSQPFKELNATKQIIKLDNMLIRQVQGLISNRIALYKKLEYDSLYFQEALIIIL